MLRQFIIKIVYVVYWKNTLSHRDIPGDIFFRYKCYKYAKTTSGFFSAAQTSSGFKKLKNKVLHG